MILKKKKPVKAQIGAIVGLASTIGKGIANAVKKKDENIKNNFYNSVNEASKQLGGNSFNANLLTSMKEDYDEQGFRGMFKDQRGFDKMYDKYGHGDQEEFGESGHKGAFEGYEFKTDEFGNFNDTDFLKDYYYELGRTKHGAWTKKKRNKIEEDVNEQMADFNEAYNQQYLGNWGSHQRAIDQQATSGMMPWGKNGGKLVSRKCGGKLQSGAKLPKKISKVSVDRKGPVKSMTKTTISGKGDGKKLKARLGKFKSPGKPSKTLTRKSGGKLETPGCVNVVVKGKLHKENNNLGNKDKGVPVITPKGEKAYEVEKQEIIFRKPVTAAIEKARDEYNKTKDDKILEDLGKLLAEELTSNTQDNDGKFGVKVEDGVCELK